MSSNWVEAKNESDPHKKLTMLLEAEKENRHNPIDLHFTYNALINFYYSKRDEKSDAIDNCINFCKKDINLFPAFRDASIKEHDDLGYDYDWTCPRIPSFQRLAIIYDRQGKYQEAIKVCELAIKYDLDDGTKGGFEGRISRLQNKQSNPPKAMKPPSKKTVERNELIKSNTIDAVDKTNAIDGFMISFSKSSTHNFERALFLAKESDYFETTEHNGQEIYQASFLPENHLDFIALYELVGNWKSAFVFKDGEMIDRKLLGKINYCYGDKLRSNEDSFCYGASMFTENPFGCHRLMIHSGNKPWHEWVKGETPEYIIIDKDAMKTQIGKKAKNYQHCPAFNYNEIISNLNKLPDRIDKDSSYYKSLTERGYDTNFTIKIDMEEGP